MLISPRHLDDFFTDVRWMVDDAFKVLDTGQGLPPCAWFLAADGEVSVWPLTPEYSCPHQASAALLRKCIHMRAVSVALFMNTRGSYSGQGALESPLEFLIIEEVRGDVGTRVHMAPVHRQPAPHRPTVGAWEIRRASKLLSELEPLVSAAYLLGSIE